MSPKKIKVGDFFIVVGNKGITHFVKIGVKVQVITQPTYIKSHLFGKLIEVKGLPEDKSVPTTINGDGDVHQFIHVDDLISIPLTLCDYDEPDYERPYEDSFRRIYIKTNLKKGLHCHFNLPTSTDKVRGRKYLGPKHLQVVYIFPRKDDNGDATNYEGIRGSLGKGFWFYYLNEHGEAKLSYANVKRFLPLF